LTMKQASFASSNGPRWREAAGGNSSGLLR
jgi:hypothetical protein